MNWGSRFPQLSRKQFRKTTKNNHQDPEDPDFLYGVAAEMKKSFHKSNVEEMLAFIADNVRKHKLKSKEEN